MPLHPAVADRAPVPLPEPLPSAVIDGHTHLDACGFDTREQVLAAMDRAASVGVAGAVTVASGPDEARWAIRAAGWHPNLYAAVAVHPTETATMDPAVRAEVAALAAHPRVVAIGETGMDLHWDTAPPAVQAEAFAWHIDLAKRLGKPLMIHDREAHGEIMDVLLAEGPPETVVFHCFSGDEAFARRCADRGFYLSFAGPVSFTNAPELAAAARWAPPELILVETDAPFLTPHPHRGRRNEPAALPYTLRALAEIRQTDIDLLAKAVRENTESCYGFSLIVG